MVELLQDITLLTNIHRMGIIIIGLDPYIVLGLHHTINQNFLKRFQSNIIQEMVIILVAVETTQV